MARRPPTHFISLPIVWGHHVVLRQRISTFTDALLSDASRITGLDPSIIISPRRLHLTLGVMTLSETNAQPDGDTPLADNASVHNALALLRSLHGRIMRILFKSQTPLKIKLDMIDIMPPERRDLKRAHVLFAGPSKRAEGVDVLNAVCNLVHQEFKKAGLVTETRPLKLHCTLINSTYRKPRPRGARIPFSYEALREAPAVAAISTAPLANTLTSAGTADGPSGSSRRHGTSQAVDLGTYMIDEIQICRMGSWGPEGEYVSVGGIDVRQRG